MADASTINRRRAGVAIAAVAILIIAVVALQGHSGTARSAITSTVPAQSSVLSESTAEATGVTTAPTEPPVSGPVAPLTGLSLSNRAVLGRPALVVKIDGHADARPQAGLDKADVVIEEQVEGISRFMAIFQSQTPDIVGPIRSARTQDALIVPMLNRPLFAWSGGNSTVTKIIAQAPLVDLSGQFLTVTQGGHWYRATDRTAPHNWMAHGARLFAMAPAGSSPPAPMFTYRPAGVGPTGRTVSGVKLSMAASLIAWRWDVSRRRWVRSEDSRPHVTADGATITAANVVVLEVQYVPSAADAHSPEAQTLGTGNVFVFTAGQVVEGTWTRSDSTQPWDLRDSAGQPIALTPGNTWVELAGLGHTAIVGPGVDAASIGYPAN